MPKCRDNLRRKRRIAKKEARIKKWCEDYLLTACWPCFAENIDCKHRKKKVKQAPVNLVGGYNRLPHPWIKRKYQHKRLS